MYEEGRKEEGRKWERERKERRREVRIGHKKIEMQSNNWKDSQAETGRQRRERKDREDREKTELWGDMTHRIITTIP